MHDGQAAAGRDYVRLDDKVGLQQMDNSLMMPRLQ